jgi:hypothetical protein
LRSPPPARALILVALTTLGACAQQATPARPGLNLSGFPSEFREGYADGCNSARSLMRKRDEARMKSDRQYAQGWRDGYDVCGQR